jgi:hypothetical protein
VKLQERKFSCLNPIFRLHLRRDYPKSLTSSRDVAKATISCPLSVLPETSHVAPTLVASFHIHYGTNRDSSVSTVPGREPEVWVWFRKRQVLILSWKVEQTEYDADHLCIIPRLKVSGILPPLPHPSSLGLSLNFLRVLFNDVVQLLRLYIVGDRKMSREHWWENNDMGNRSTQRKTCPSVTLIQLVFKLMDANLFINIILNKY